MEYVEESFEYMLHHELIEGDRIKHFSIYDCLLEDIQPALILWMKQEGERLRQRDHWSIIPSNKRFGDGHFVLAYDTLFRYQQCDYRLRLDDCCVDMYCCCEIDRGECIDCESEDESTVHFELVKVVEPIKKIPLVIKKEQHVLSEEFRTIPCEPVLEWDAEL